MGFLLNPYRFAPPGIAYTTTKSLDLDGGDYVNFGNILSTLLNGANAFTIEGYVEIDNLDPAGANATFFFNKRLNTAGPGVIAYWTVTGGLYLFIQGTGGASDRLWCRTVTGSVTTGSWLHFAITYNGSKNTSGVTFYIGGSAQTRDSDISNGFTTTAANTRDLWVGDRENASGYMDGRIYRVSVWDKVLSGAEVVEARDILDANGLNGHSAAANLVWYPRFGNDPLDDATDGTGVIKDRVGGFDGTPVGTVAGNIVTNAPTP